MHLLGQEGERRGHPQVEDRCQLIGRRGDELPVEAQHLAGILERMEDRSGQHDRPHGVKPVLERGDDAEVAAAATDAPEEVRVLILAGGENLAVGRHQVDRDQVVYRRPVLSHEPADTAAQGEPRDAGVRDDPAYRRQSVKLRLAVELAPQHAGLRPGRTRHRIDPDPLHRREVDHEAAFAERVTADAVAAGAHRYQQVSPAGEVNRGDDIGDSRAASDAGGAAVDRSVPDRTRGVVARVGGKDHRAAEAGAQVLDFDGRRLRDRRPGCHGGTVGSPGFC